MGQQFSIAPVLQRLEAEGAQLSEILRVGGLGNDFGVESVCTFPQARSLLRAALRAAPPGIGLRLGRHWNVDYGELGALLPCCRTLRHVSAVFRHFYSLSCLPIMFNDFEDGHDWTIELIPVVPFAGEVMLLVEDFLSRTKIQLSEFTGAANPIRRIEVSYPAPQHWKQYERMLNCPVTFGRRKNLICVNRELLEMNISQPNSGKVVTKSVISRQMHRLVKRYPAKNLVKSTVIRELLRAPGYTPKLEKVSLSLGTRPSNLKRWLRCDGVSFSSVVDEAKLDYLSDVLLPTGMSAKSISFALGYSNVHNFYRAVRRWTGLTFAQLRSMDTEASREKDQRHNLIN